MSRFIENLPEEPDIGNHGVVSEENMEGYYRPKEHKPRYGLMAVLFIIIIIGFAIIWFGGFLKPVDTQKEYDDLIARICTISKRYVSDKKLANTDVNGKVVYIKLRDLVNDYRIESNLVNPLNKEAISLNTDIRLPVIDKNSVTCSGFIWPGDDKEKPTIHLVGDAVINTTRGASFTDPGATANDNLDGNITEQIETSGTVNFNLKGTYIIMYSVTDRADNIATITRTIVVH